MLKRLTNVVLILAVGGSVVVGMPMHSGGESDMMDCCKAALERNDSPRVAAARLCCAMNCNEPGSTNGNASQSFRLQGVEPASVFVASPQATNYKSFCPAYSIATSISSKPAYILNLALLI